MTIYWLEQTEADLPEPSSGAARDTWLTQAERIHLSGFRFPKRRADWRLGRWTAKRALVRYLNLPDPDSALSAFEVRAASDGAPEAFTAGRPVPAVISLSHRAGLAVCAVGPCGTALGCDLELIEPRNDSFAADYFTREEQTLIAEAAPADRETLTTLFWSGRESALKALREGLRLDTRCVTVSLGEGSGAWRPLQVRHDAGRIFHGWWQIRDGMVRTLVTDPPSRPPVEAPKTIGLD
jgi:4'-phosphopantetheinyl transferase